MSKANASVTGGTFNNCTARFQETLLFGILDNEESRPILNTTAGVLELCLAQNITTGLLRKTLQSNEWSVANCYTRNTKKFR